jgi:hypothetical protein
MEDWEHRVYNRRIYTVEFRDKSGNFQSDEIIARSSHITGLCKEQAANLSREWGRGWVSYEVVDTDAYVEQGRPYGKDWKEAVEDSGRGCGF